MQFVIRPITIGEVSNLLKTNESSIYIKLKMNEIGFLKNL